MRVTQRRVKTLSAEARAELRRSWEYFWSQFTDAELEILTAGSPINAYKALCERAERLGYSELDRKSTALGLSIGETLG